MTFYVVYKVLWRETDITTEQSAAQIMQRPTSRHSTAHRSLHIAPAVRGVVFGGVSEREKGTGGEECVVTSSVQGDLLSNVAHWPDVKGKMRALRQQAGQKQEKKYYRRTNCVNCCRDHSQ